MCTEAAHSRSRYCQCLACYGARPGRSCAFRKKSNANAYAAPALLAAPAAFVVAMPSYAGATISSAAIDGSTTMSASNVIVAAAMLETVMVTSRKC